MPSGVLTSKCSKFIAEVGLTEKRNTYAASLSGGMRRKLSLAIALIGDSKIIVLDEPTSGMDPYSRRFTWDVIQKHRAGRIVVLTTHFMDEADLLGDRIAIMAEGKLRCVGTSLFLKNHYGVGYILTIEKQSGLTKDREKAMTDLVAQHVPSASGLSNVGTEISFQLPFAASAAFPALLRTIEDHKEELGVINYGVSVTTLEEVFIKVGEGAHGIQHGDGVTTPGDTGDIGDAPDGGAERQHSGHEEGRSILGREDSLRMKMENSERRSSRSLIDRTAQESQLQPSCRRHCGALLVKRALFFKRDCCSWLCTGILPSIFLLFAVILLFVSPPIVRPEYEFQMSQYVEVTRSSLLIAVRILSL